MHIREREKEREREKDMHSLMHSRCQSVGPLTESLSASAIMAAAFEGKSAVRRDLGSVHPHRGDRLCVASSHSGLEIVFEIDAGRSVEPRKHRPSHELVIHEVLHTETTWQYWWNCTLLA